MPIKIGLIGKTNTGKTTFFNSSTLSSDEISTYPFTTKKSSTFPIKETTNETR